LVSSPRWRQDRLWFSDWGPPEVIAVDLAGNREVILQAPAFPCCVDWLPDGDLLLVSAREGLLLRREDDGSLLTYADLNAASQARRGMSLSSTVPATPTSTAAAFRADGRRAICPRGHRIGARDGSVRQVADGLAFLLIVRELLAGPKRYTDLRPGCPDWPPIC
jgi:hypothetical protein